MNTCHLCQASAVDELRNFGSLPLCNRLLSNPSESEALFPMVLGQCSRCGLIQMMQPVPPAELRTRLPWLTYTEPAGHLDRLVTTILKLPSVTFDSSVLGIFLPTDKTLDWFSSRGFKRTRRLEFQKDLGVDDPCAGTETIQDRLDADIAKRIGATGRPDIIVMRHILEHTHDIQKLMQSLRQLANPRGYVVFEVPDYENAFAQNDYSGLWEEHISYFTLPTFVHCLQTHGWHVVHQEQTGVSLVAVAQLSESKPPAPAYSVAKELARGQAFARAFPECRKRVQEFAKDFSNRVGEIVMFGAGHLSCVFINLMEFKEQLAYVIDDHERKQGMFMPGSKLPIRSSQGLLGREVALCLSSLGTETDAKLLAKNPAVRDFAARGGKLRSLLPGPNYFLAEAA